MTMVSFLRLDLASSHFEIVYARRLSPNGRPSSIFNKLWDASDINASDDVVCDDRDGQASILYHSQHGALDLEQIVVAANEYEQQLWIDSDPGPYQITERGIVGTDPTDPLSDFPAIAGRLERRDIKFVSIFYDVFVLLPWATP